ncbi:MAG: hypothetical protein A2Y69_05320 [Candidatus Aminicenantes bacterium RBG_13_59_9]|nr:MAG: hypothetical protein A2Y69_05320 [Candidatus Aminicenantes bacterium RBG_13_59_9]
MTDENLLNDFLTIQPSIRRRFPQAGEDGCGNRRIHLNSAAGTLVVDTAAAALGESARHSNPQPGDQYPAEIATRRFHDGVRSLVADFIQAPSAEEVSFHSSTTNALFNLAISLKSFLKKENNLIVTDLDHMANVSPWESVWGVWQGSEIRRARIDPKGFLDVEHLLSLVDRKTGLVAVTMASNAFGSLVPLKELSARVKEKSPGCLVCVDAVHHAPHGPIDVQEIGCDFLAFSGYKLFGPMAGVLWGRLDLLEQLAPYRVETNKNKPPHKFEQGALNNPVLASLQAALEYLLWLAAETAGSAPKPEARKDAFGLAMRAISRYESELTRVVLEGLREMDRSKIRFYGPADLQSLPFRDPTFLFEIEGRSASEVKAFFWSEAGIQIADGHHYSAAVYRHLKKMSLCRASLAHYNTIQEALIFLECLGHLVKS